MRRPASRWFSLAVPGRCFCLYWVSWVGSRSGWALHTLIPLGGWAPALRVPILGLGHPSIEMMVHPHTFTSGSSQTSGRLLQWFSELSCCRHTWSYSLHGPALVPHSKQAKRNIFVQLPQGLCCRFFAMVFLLLSLTTRFLGLPLTQTSLPFVFLSHSLSPSLCHGGFNASVPRCELQKAASPNHLPLERVWIWFPLTGRIMKSPEHGDCLESIPHSITP